MFRFQVNINEENRASLIHLNSIISPLLETYWLVTASLDAYVGENRVAGQCLLFYFVHFYMHAFFAVKIRKRLIFPSEEYFLVMP